MQINAGVTVAEPLFCGLGNAQIRQGHNARRPVTTGKWPVHLQEEEAIYGLTV